MKSGEKKEEKNKSLLGKKPENRGDRRFQSFDLHHFILCLLVAIKSTLLAVLLLMVLENPGKTPEL